MIDPQLSIARAISTLRASAASSAAARPCGSALLVGMNRAAAPFAARMRAGSRKLESLQMRMPNVRAPVVKTGI